MQQTIIGYHATNKTNLESILHDNFKYKKSNTHWLGNGVYFFADMALAKQWAYNTPTNKYGIITDPVIIKTQISIDEADLCDMRLLDDYNWVVNSFENYWSKISHTTKKIDNYQAEKLRCAFFDILVQKQGLKCIIASFDQRKLSESISDPVGAKIFGKFHINYAETQICVPDTTCIVSKEVVLLDDIFNGKRNNQSKTFCNR